MTETTETLTVACGAAVLLVAGLLLSGPSDAHHSPAAFDRTQEVRLEGTVTRFAYNNPHSYLTIEIVGDDGRRISQEIEVAPISTVRPLGLTRDSLQVGDRVTVRANPSRRGTGTVMGLDVTRMDGRVLPLHISAASVRPMSTALATSIEGVWLPATQAFSATFAALPSWPMTELGRQEFAEARRANSTTHSDCVPAGAPMLMLYPVALSIEVDEKSVVFDIDWLGARRVVRLDGTHPVALPPSLQGDSIGRWEGDTLVLDSIGFTDETWLGRGGKFHSDQMRVIEKFTRAGNQVLYEVTVEDPEVLVQPWVMPARTLRISNNPVIIGERGSCTDSELSEVSSQIRH